MALATEWVWAVAVGERAAFGERRVVVCAARDDPYNTIIRIVHGFGLVRVVFYLSIYLPTYPSGALHAPLPSVRSPTSERPPEQSEQIARM